MSGPLGISSYVKAKQTRKSVVAVNQKTQMGRKPRKFSLEEMFSMETENLEFLLEFA